MSSDLSLAKSLLLISKVSVLRSTAPSIFSLALYNAIASGDSKVYRPSPRADAVGETTLADDIWRELPDDSLCTVDREFLAARRLRAIEGQGVNRHWMTRAKTKTRWRTIKTLGKGDELVELEFCDATRRRNPEIPEHADPPKTAPPPRGSQTVHSASETQRTFVSARRQNQDERLPKETLVPGVTKRKRLN
jgi:hypothetical protein